MPMGNGQLDLPKRHWWAAYRLSPHRFAQSLNSGNLQREAGSPWSARPRSSGWMKRSCADGLCRTKWDMYPKYSRSFTLASSTCFLSWSPSHGRPHGQEAFLRGGGPSLLRCRDLDQVVTSGVTNRHEASFDASSHDVDDKSSKPEYWQPHCRLTEASVSRNSAPVETSPAK